MDANWKCEKWRLRKDGDFVTWVSLMTKKRRLNVDDDSVKLNNNFEVISIIGERTFSESSPFI